MRARVLSTIDQKRVTLMAGKDIELYSNDFDNV